MVVQEKWTGPSARIWARVCGLPGERRRKRQLLVLQARIDGSASENGETYALAGYIAPAEKWAALVDDWQNELNQPPRLKKFSMRRMARSGVKRARTEKFYRIIEDHVSGAVFCVLKADELAKVVERTLGPPGVLKWEGMKTPFYFAVRAITQLVARHSDKLHITEPVDFIFDAQTEQQNVRNAWNYMYLSVTPDIRKMLGKLPEFVTDDDDIALQAADLKAWFARRWAEKGIIGNPSALSFRTEGFNWGTSRPMPCLGYEFTEEHFQKEINRLVENAEEIKKISTLTSAEVEDAVVALKRAESS